MGYSPWGGKGVRHDFLTKQQQAVQGQNERMDMIEQLKISWRHD